MPRKKPKKPLTKTRDLPDTPYGVAQSPEQRMQFVEEAEKLVALTQGNACLEGQGVSQEVIAKAIEDTIEILAAGPLNTEDDGAGEDDDDIETGAEFGA